MLNNKLLIFVFKNIRNIFIEYIYIIFSDIKQNHNIEKQLNYNLFENVENMEEKTNYENS